MTRLLKIVLTSLRVACGLAASVALVAFVALRSLASWIADRA